MISNNLKKFKNVVTMEGLLGEITGKEGDITKNNVLSNSSIVYSCINLIASTVARMSINLYESDEKNNINKINNDLSYMVSVRPYKYYSQVDFIQAMVTNMLIMGNAFAMIDFKKGVPSNLIILPLNTQLLEVQGEYVVSTMINNQQINIPYEKVLHFKDLTLNGVKGESRISSILNKINTQNNGEKMLNSFYTNGGGVKGFIEVADTKLTTEKKKILKESALSILNGSLSGIGILDAGMKYINVANSTVADTQFLDNMKLTKEEICSIFGVNPALVGASDNTSYSNMVEMSNNFIQTLLPLLCKLEQEMDYKLLTKKQKLNTFFRFNASTALRGSDEQRASFYKTMLEAGVMTLNECRKKENLNSVEGGDTLRVSLNYVSLDKADIYQELKAKGGKGNE